MLVFFVFWLVGHWVSSLRGLFIRYGHGLAIILVIDFRPISYTPPNPFGTTLNERVRLLPANGRAMPKVTVDFDVGFLVMRIWSSLPKERVGDYSMNTYPPGPVQGLLDTVRIPPPYLEENGKHASPCAEGFPGTSFSQRHMRPTFFERRWFSQCNSPQLLQCLPSYRRIALGSDSSSISRKVAARSG